MFRNVRYAGIDVEFLYINQSLCEWNAILKINPSSFVYLREAILPEPTLTIVSFLVTISALLHR